MSERDSRASFAIEVRNDGACSLVFLVTRVVQERIGEASRALLRVNLVDDDELAHEVQESASVRVGVARRDLRSVSHVDPDFDVMFAPLFEVVRLQVVDDRQVVDVAAA